jgi:DNA-binding transcriptional ArsR family regulator
VITIDFTVDDLARTVHVPEPAPLVELKLSLMMLRRHDNDVFFGRWRQRLRRTLPPATAPLWDLVSAYRGPAFLDPLSGDLKGGLATVRESPRPLILLGLRQIPTTRAGVPAAWTRGLLDGDRETWDLLCQALESAYDTALGPAWHEVRTRHRAAFGRYALTAAENGTAAALEGVLPGSRFSSGTLRLPAPYDRRVRLEGRGLTLLPTFHWTDAPVTADLPERPVLLVYPAGPGMPLPRGGVPAGDPLEGVLGTTRARILRLLDAEYTTSGIAHEVGVSVATASAHLAALRGAGLVTSARASRSVRHRRSALGHLLDGASACPAGGPPAVRPARE